MNTEELTPIEEIIKDGIIEDGITEQEPIETPCTIIKDGKVSKLTFTPDDKYNIGESFEDYLDGKMVILSDEQVAFYEAHPNASISEVWGMKLAEPYEPTLDDLKRDKIAEIIAYDSSDAVNGFLLDGFKIWLDKETRVGLINLINRQVIEKRTNTTLWFNGVNFTLPCEVALDMLTKLEVYAGDCFNVTEQHKYNVNEVKSKEDVLRYDFTVGYPEILTLKTT